MRTANIYKKSGDFLYSCDYETLIHRDNATVLMDSNRETVAVVPLDLIVMTEVRKIDQTIKVTWKSVLTLLAFYVGLFLLFGYMLTR